MKFILAILFLSSCCTFTQQTSSVRRTLADSVLLVTVITDEFSATGTAFVINNTKDSSQVLTNRHICSKGDDATYQITDSNNNTYSASFVKYSTNVDVCLLSTDAILSSIKLATTDSKYGDKILVIGAPNGIMPMFTDGYVGGYKYILLGETNFVAQYISAPIYPGNSGSPVFNNKDTVVGIIFAGIRGKDHMSLMVPIELVNQFLNNKENIKDNE